jgi:hypothetical protein
MIPDGSYTLDSLLKFLKYAGMEGLINPASARSRRNAAEQLASELTSAERNDLRKVDVDELASRFHKLEESSIRSEALDLYAQRLKMALTDFFAWMEDSAGFKSIGGERHRAIRRGTAGASAISREQEAAEQIALEATENPSSIVPIPLRDQLVVYVANLPLNLSASEADKITRVIQAYVSSDGSAEQAEGDDPEPLP